MAFGHVFHECGTKSFHYANQRTECNHRVVYIVMTLFRRSLLVTAIRPI